jgi:L,D-peptidoglycan transpeptidase YkuD (ErfK/YbiS/YcfS/YnhG family)
MILAPVGIALLASCTGGSKPNARGPAGSIVSTTTSSTAAATSPTPTATPTTSAPAPTPTPTPTPPPSKSVAAVPAAPSPQSLPLAYSTGSATEVITVVARSTSSTTATLQRWTKSGSGWLPFGAAVTAHLGSAGMTTHPSESLSATPIGSYTLTQAFGRDANPGTKLPYLQTTPDDWWISQAGPLYNTHQRCASNCAFTQGDPNEHLYYEVPYYDYAVVIDYNTAPVTQAAGSAFFLHVTDGKPTACCVSVPMATEVSILDWLDPAASPRILIGTG